VVLWPNEAVVRTAVAFLCRAVWSEQTGLRFFTVYGPWGRPDMAYRRFTDAILREKAVPVFGKGLLRRDFTFVGNIVAGLVVLIEALIR